MVERPPDGGPIYAETGLGNILSEPWNSISSIAIILPAIYWAIKLKDNYKDYAFLYYCVPLLFLGGLGSTLFHGLRTSRVLLFLDFMPTAILMISVSIYFWWKVLPKAWLVPVIFVGVFCLRFVFFYFFPNLASINSNYFFTGLAIFLPVLFYLIKSSWKHAGMVFISVISLLAALFFRNQDQVMSQWIYMGSHFMWHIFSGVGGFYLAFYLFKLRNDELSWPSA